MKLTIDASIVVKWFVAEPLSDAARRLLSHRIGPLTDLWRRLTRVWAAMGTPPGIVRSVAPYQAGQAA